MSDVVIRTERLGKSFPLQRQVPHSRLTDELWSGLKGWWQPRSITEPFWALKDVSLQIRQGEVVGLIGHNGAGKSTLLKLLCRILHPTTGRMELHGRVGSLLEVGTGFHPELTGRENVYLNGAILGMSQAEVRRKFDEIVEFADVAEFLDLPVKRYSSGMTVRLAFAVAAHLDPEILLVDEVLAVGDAQFQRKCLDRMSAVAQSGRTIVFVSHNTTAVQRLCQRIILLSHGQATEFASPEDALREYLAGLQEPTAWVRTGPEPASSHLQRIALCRFDGSPLDVPDSASAFGVTIDYRLTKACPGVLLAMAVSTVTGTPLFSTANPDAQVVLPSQPGDYRVQVMFPEALFMPKRFTLTVALYSQQETYDRVDAGLTFDVAAASSLATSLPGGRWGELQILCDWSTPVCPPTVAAS
jgi:lipopolysaccharide transport system ATP-binding protein